MPIQKCNRESAVESIACCSGIHGLHREGRQQLTRSVRERNEAASITEFQNDISASTVEKGIRRVVDRFAREFTRLSSREDTGLRLVRR